MSETVIKVENLSKQYRLGTIGTGTLRSDFQRFWANLTGKEDPTLKIGSENTISAQNQKSKIKNQKSESDYVWALKDINFEVKQGEVLGIIGKNGAGKSTLLKILSQVTTPSTGNVKVKGRIASLLEVGTGFHPELTGRENIFLNGAILGMTKTEIRSKFDEIVDFSGIEKHIDTPVKRYSSGMYVRLAFAVAAHLDPEIMIVDEVLAVGDAEFQRKALGKMHDVSKGQGRTVLFVSHNLLAVNNLCTSGLLLQNGKISFHNNDISKVIEKYESESNEKIDVPKGIYLFPNEANGIFKIETYFNNNQTNSFTFNGEIKLLFYLKDLVIPKIKLGIVIKDHLSTPLIGINNIQIGQSLVNKDRIEVIIQNLPLYFSNYYSVDVYLGDEKEDYQILENAFTFKMEASDIYKSGILLEGKFNKVILKDIRFS